MTNTHSNVRVQGGSWELLVNETGERLLDGNLRWLGTPQYTPEEIAFAKSIQRATNVPEVGLERRIVPANEQKVEGGSTDVGDVSWVVPTLHLTVVTSPKDAPWHAWPVVATAGMSIGHKGMITASQTLAATMVDLYEKPQLLRDIRAEFEKKRGNVVYKAWLPDGPPELPKED